jgi:hypothetical protein
MDEMTPIGSHTYNLCSSAYFTCVCKSSIAGGTPVRRTGTPPPPARHAGGMRGVPFPGYLQHI